MNKITLILVFFTINLISGQTTKPNVKLLSTTTLIGLGDSGDDIQISTNNDSTPEFTVKVNNDGFFEYTFAVALTAGNNILIWAENNKVKSETVSAMVESDSQIATKMAKSITDNSEVAVVNKLDEEAFALRNTALTYKVWIVNTNFNIPLARFNLLEQENETKVGDLILFSSIGAGVGISAGRMERIRDNSGKITSE
jgi:hypothetical protein